MHFALPFRGDAQKSMVRQKANTQIALEMVCWLPNTS
jgi:hypothetical protein